MLTKFSVKNFRGFPEKIELDLTHPNSYEYNSFAIRDGIIKNGIIYGPNGSGKTNFGLAMFDIVNHLSQKVKRGDYYVNFAYAGRKNDNVEFEYEFRFGNTVVDYSYSKNHQGILMSEAMSVNGEEVFNKTKNIFSIDTSQYPMDANIKKNIAQSANNISIFNYLVSTYPLPKGHYILLMRQFVDSMLWYQCLEERSFIGFENHVDSLEEVIIKRNLVKDFQNFLKNVSDQRFAFVEPNPGDKFLVCKIDGGTIPFLQIASQGTKALELLYYWYKKISSASFVFIDEFDAFYHFDLSFKVCKKLFDLKCQVFLTSHNTYLMTNDLLRPDCNFILDHNIIKPLVDCSEKELRFGHNIEKMYRGGAFRV